MAKVYAIKSKTKDKWIGRKHKSIRYIVDKLEEAAFYHNQVGPAQLLGINGGYDKEYWEIKEYFIVDPNNEELIRYVFQENCGKYVSNNPKDEWHTLGSYQIYICDNIKGASLFLLDTIPLYLKEIWGKYNIGKILKVNLIINKISEIKDV